MASSNDPFAGSGFEDKTPQPEQTPQPTVAPQQPTNPSSDPFAGSGFEDKPKLSDVHRQVMDSPASKNAQVLKLSTQSGMTPQQVAQNPEAVEKAVSAPTPTYLDGLHETHPITAQWSSVPKNMASVHNQIPGLAAIEDISKSFSKGINQFGADFLGKAVLRGPLESGGVGPFSWNKEDVQALHDNFQSTADFISSPELNQDALNEYMYHNNLTPLVSQVVNGIPSLAAQSVGFVIGRGAAAEQAFLQTTGEAFDRGENIIPALAKGTIAGGVAFFTAGYFQKLYAPLAKTVGAHGAKEIINESIVHFGKTNAAMIGGSEVQRLSNAIIDKSSGENPKALEQFIENTPKSLAGETGQSLLMTLPALGYTVMVHAPGAIKEGKTEANQAEAVQTYNEQTAQAAKDTFLKLHEAAKATKITTDNPGQAKDFHDKLGEENGHATVHIPVEQFQEIFQDDAPKMAEKMGPEFKESFEKAAGVDGKSGTGGTVHGPTSDLLTSKEDFKPQELADHVKFDPNGKTVFEAGEDKKELEEAQKTKETEDEKALADFQKMVKEGADKIGGKVASGSETQAKGIANVLKNMADVLKKPVSIILQDAKMRILKEKTAKEDFNQAYDNNPGIPTTVDYLKRNGIKIRVEDPDPKELVGENLEQAKSRVASQRADIEKMGLKWSKDGKSPADIAQDLFDFANDGVLNKEHLPQEWWDEGKSGRPDADLDHILELVRAGSGIEAFQNYEEKLSTAAQEKFQSDPMALPPEDQKEIFGNVVKESAVDKVFNDKTLKPNLNAKQQDMFGAKETKPEGPQQEMFQSSNDWDKLKRGADWERFKRKGNELMEMKPGVKEPGTGRIWKGDEHNDVVAEAQNEGAKVTFQDCGFVMKDGTFITRDEAERRFGIMTSTELKDRQEFFQSGEAEKEFHQSHRGRITISGLAGEPQGREFNVYASQSGDQSTLFHEFSHAFLQIFRDHVSQGDAPEEAREMEAQLLKWFDVKSWEDVGDRHSEMFARGFEYRLWEGKSPSGLEKVFNKFAEWMRKIYPSSQVMETYLKNVGATMTDEMRAVYDRFIASSEEIEAAEKTMGYKKEAPEGLTPEEMNEWKSKQDKATQDAMSRLNTQKMKGLTKEAQQNIAQERHDAEEKAGKEVDALPIFQAKKDLEELVSGLEGRTKEIADKYMEGKGNQIDNDALQYIALKNHFNNPAELAYGLANCDRAKEIQNRVDDHMEKFTPKIKASPQEAQMAVLGGEDRRDAVAYEGALIKQMLSDVSAMKGTHLKGEMEKAEGKPAVTGITDAKPERTPEEISARRKAVFKQYQEDIAAAKTKAMDQMNTAKLNDAKAVRTYMSDMTNATKKADKFKKEGNLEKYTEWHDRQLLNHELALQAVKNQKIIPKWQKGLRDMAKIENKPLAMPFGHWLQMKNLLEQVGEKRPKPIQDVTFRKIAKTMQDEGKTNDQIADATGFTADEDGKFTKETLPQFKNRIMKVNAQLAGRINPPKEMSYKNMTLDDLRNLKNSLEAIKKQGTDANTLKLSEGEMSLDNFFSNAIQKLHDQFGRKEGDKVAMPHDEGMNFPHPVSAAINGALNADDICMPYSAQFPRVIKDLDGGDKGPFNEIGDMMIKGGFEKSRMSQERTEKFQEIKNKYYTPKEWDDVMDKYVFAKTSVGKHFLTKAMLHGIYELRGTKEGLTYLKTGIGYTDEDLMQLGNMLDKKDIDFIHEHNEKMVSKKWPDIVRMEMELNGVEPKPVDLLPVETQHGIRTGVYRPLEPDPKNNFAARTIEDLLKVSRMDSDNAAGWHPMRMGTDKDFTKERSNIAGISPNLSRSVWDKYHEKAENYLAYQPALKEINKVLTDKNFMNELHRAIGPGAKIFENQIRYIISGQSVEEGVVGKTIGNMRRLVVASLIGLRGTLFALKLGTDGLNAFAEKDGGLKWMGNQLKYGLNLGMSIPLKDGSVKQATLYGNPKMRDIITKICDMNPEMREQATSYEYNAMEFSKINLEHNWLGKMLATANLPRVDKMVTQNMLTRWLGLNTYLAERNADATVRFPKWWDVYQNERAQGTSHEKAMIQATKITDNLLGSAKMRYHTGPQRGGELEKQLTPVLSFATNQFGQFMQKYYRPAKTDVFRNGPGMLFKMALVCSAGVMQYFIAPSLMKSATNYITGKDKNLKEAVKDLAKTSGSEAFQGIPLAGYGYHYLETGKLDLPFQQSLEANGTALHALGLTHMGKMSEQDWDKELQGFSADTGFPKSIDTIIMNFVDHLDRQDEWSWKKDLSVKRRLSGSKKAPWLNP